MRNHHLGARNRMVARVLKSMVGMVVPDMPGVNNRIPRQRFHLFWLSTDILVEAVVHEG